MLNSHLLLMLMNQDLDDVLDLFHFHNLIHFYRFVYDLLKLESNVLDLRDYAHVNTKRNHQHEYQNGIHQIHETKYKRIEI
jgi:hypothetical protein